MGHSKGHLWTPDEDRQILDLLGQGYSARQIAAEMDGPSRNAVIGRIMRAKALREHGFAYKAGEQLRTRIETKTNLICDEVAVAVLPQHGKALLHLKDGECKWPLIFDQDIVGHWWMCGRKAAPGRVYCPMHTRIKQRGNAE